MRQCVTVSFALGYVHSDFGLQVVAYYSWVFNVSEIFIRALSISNKPYLGQPLGSKSNNLLCTVILNIGKQSIMDSVIPTF